MQAFITWVSNWFMSYFTNFLDMFKGIYEWLWDYFIQYVSDNVFPLINGFRIMYPGIDGAITVLQPYLGFLNWIFPISEMASLMSLYVMAYFSYNPAKVLYRAMRG